MKVRFKNQNVLIADARNCSVFLCQLPLSCCFFFFQVKPIQSTNFLPVKKVNVADFVALYFASVYSDAAGYTVHIKLMCNGFKQHKIHLRCI